MPETIKQVEGVPAEWPLVPFGFLSDSELDLAWQRIESYIAHRWTPREVVWTVEGAGEWAPPLAPVVDLSAEQWDGVAWGAVDLAPGPYGYCLPCDGPYRLTATVGGGDLPAIVAEAHTRLARYVSAISRTPADRMAMRKVAKNSYEDRPYRQTPAQDAIRLDDTDGSVEFATNWPARALQLSGAADLLRAYRRA